MVSPQVFFQARPVSIGLSTAFVITWEVSWRVVNACDMSGESVLAEKHPRAVVTRVLELLHMPLLSMTLQETPVVELFLTAGLRASEFEFLGMHRLNVTIEVIVPGINVRFE